MANKRISGFTLIELAITLTVIGVVVAFSVPALYLLSGSQSLKGASENIASQLRLAREKAVSTGTAQPIHFVGMKIYHVHYPTGIAAGTQWTLPPQINFGRSMGDWYTMNPDGRVVQSGGADGVIPLVDNRGNCDTITVQSSGTVLAN